MKLPRVLHRWNVTPRRAVQLQENLASRVRLSGSLDGVRLVAGADMAFTADDLCIAGVVVWDAQEGRAIEEQVAVRRMSFPYVPGLLTFREGPAVLAALRKVKNEPEAFIFDGQGLAHPRRMGLASHMGVLIDRPSVGCAKSRLCGEHHEPESQRGCTSPLTADGEQIGTVLRTRDGVRCVYVSIGHKVSLDAAVGLVLRCSTGCRLPEPTRLADKLVARVKLQLQSGELRLVPGTYRLARQTGR